MTAKQIHVVFDGQCQFCIGTLHRLRRFDLHHCWRFHDANSREEIAAQFPQLNGADLDDAMFVVVENEPIYRGFFAFRRMVLSTPLLWFLLPVFYFPTAGFFGERIYGLVARNRSKLGCQSAVCMLDTERKMNLLHPENVSR